MGEGFAAVAQHQPGARRRVRPRSPRASCPRAGRTKLPVFEAGKGVATRAASGKVLQALGAVIPELWGGSADLAGSNNTTIDKTSLVPARRTTRCRRPTRTAARSTSASASTPWPRR